jgi:hypothetical protein
VGFGMGGAMEWGLGWGAESEGKDTSREGKSPGG